MNEEKSIKTYAEQELDILVKSSTDPDNRPIIEKFIPEILALVKKFRKSGQSGGSAPYTAEAISQAVKKLCLQQPICPITGIEEEWTDVSEVGGNNGAETLFQNKRYSALFKSGIDSAPYYLDAIVWQGEDEYDSFTGTVDGIRSRGYIKSFPFEPKTFYIDVIKEELPGEWNEEPFTEGNGWYEEDEYKRTGVKVWHKNKYRYHIKDKKQLKEVEEYYDLCRD